MQFGRKPQSEGEIRANYVEKIISNAFSRNRPSSTPIISEGDVNIDPQQSFKVLDQTERGELIYAEVAVNSALMIPEIILYDERLQPLTTINKKSFLELLQLGRGMTPGSVQASATGQTQDEKSVFMFNIFHIARYKDDLLADWTANADALYSSERWFVGRFVANIPIPYNAISFYIKNTTTDSQKHVYSYSLARTVYEAGGTNPIIENPNPQTVEVPQFAELDENEVDIVDPEGITVNYDSRPT